MKLYWGPHTCAIGIHILLEKIGRSYETEKLDVSGGATHEARWLARIFAPVTLAPQGVAHNTTGLEPAAAKKQGRELVETGFAILDPQLGCHPYAAEGRIQHRGCGPVLR
jgi:glutathione S-transferase